MKCEYCNEKEATFFYEQTLNGKTKSMRLCTNCAAKLQSEGKLHHNLSTDFWGDAVPDLFGELFGLPKRINVQEINGKSCPTCGSHWEEIAAVGRAFCPDCYTAFREELMPGIRSIHGNVTHIGHMPAKLAGAAEKKNKLETLRKALTSAIAEENFEEAARLRDEIRSLAEN